MSQQDAHLSQLSRQQNLRRALKWALWIHVAIIVVAAIGLPSWRKKPFDVTQAVSVDLVAATGDISAAPNVAKRKAPPAPKKEKKEDKPPVAQDKPPTPVQSDAAKKEDVPKPEEKNLEKPKEKTKDLKKDATEKADDKVKLDKADKKKKTEDDNKGEKQKQEEFNSILKNLLGDTNAPEGTQVGAPVKEDAKTEGSAPTTSETLALSEMDALRYQLARCWNIPSGAMNAEDLIVDIRIEVNPDRTVQSAEIVDQMRYNSDTFFRAAAESARRAVFNPMCSPLALPPEKYEIWKNILIRFNPREMFGG